MKWSGNVRSGEDMGIKDEGNDDESPGDEHGDKKPADGRVRRE